MSDDDYIPIYETEAIRKDANTVVALRTLDVLYALLRATDPIAFKTLINKHAEGGLIGPAVGFDPEGML